MKKQNKIKRILCGILSCLFLATSFAAISVSAETDTKTCEAHGVPLGAITVDGKIDDIWKSEGVVSYDVSAVRSGETTNTASADVSLMWDGTHLYVLAEFTDQTKFTEGTSPWEEDSFEVIMTYSGNKIRRALRVGRDGTFSGSNTSGAESNFAPGQWPWSYAAYSETENGWIVEYQIQLNFAQQSTGTQIKAAKSMEIDFAYNDGTVEKGGRQSLIGWGTSTDYGICTLTYNVGTALSIGNQEITVDGDIDDVWQKATSYALTDVRNGSPNDITANVKFLWDGAQYLYILADINDDTPSTTTQWWVKDAFDMTFAISGSTAGTSKTERFQIARDGGLNGYVSDETVGWGFRQKNVSKTKEKADGTGWVAECRLDIGNVSEQHSGAKMDTAGYISIDFACYDTVNDATSRAGMKGWSVHSDSKDFSAGKTPVSDLGRIYFSKAELTGSSITVGSDLTMNYYVKTLDNAVESDLSKLSMRFTMNDDVKTVAEYSIVDGEYVFAFDGIAPQNMGDSIKAELLYDGKVIDVKDGYSIKDNAAELLSEYANDEKTVRFVTDMLNYGAAAQNYANYKTDAPVNDVAGMGEASTAAPTEADKFVLSGNTTEGIKIESASVLFDNVNKIGFKLSISDDKAESVKIMLDGVEVALADLEDLGNGSYILLTEELKTTQFDMDFELVLMDGETEVSNLTYSVNSYAYSMKDNAKMGALASALYRLGVSAEAYNA